MLLLRLSFVVVWLLWPSSLRADEVISPNAAEAPFNSKVMDLVGEYPQKGFGGYRWPAKRGTHGTTRDLYQGNKRIARAGSGNHCVGVTFEIMWRALSTASSIDRLSARQVRRLRALWFVPEAGGMGPAEALPRFKLGRRISNLEKALEGDFIQVWNKDRTFGHSAVFISWVVDTEKRIVGVKYWSSQPWTEGIGIADLTIGDEDGDIDPDSVFVARIILPENR